MVQNDEEKNRDELGGANVRMVDASQAPADAASVVIPVWATLALPGDARQFRIVLQNDGLNTWRNADGYALVNISDPLEVQEPQPVPHDVAPGETATWTVTVTAPDGDGMFSWIWQLVHSGEPVGDPITIWVGVLPQ